jgi:hypothetical protein
MPTKRGISKALLRAILRAECEAARPFREAIAIKRERAGSQTTRCKGRMSGVFWGDTIGKLGQDFWPPKVSLAIEGQRLSHSLPS